MLRKFRHLNLYSRILLWFLLNVVVLAGAIFGVLRWQFRDGFRGALGTMVTDRLQAIGQKVHANLTGRPVAEWSAVLDALSTTHKVRASIIVPPEQWVAGHRLEVPPEVHEKLDEMLRRGRRGPGPPGGPPDAPPPPPRDPVDEFLFGEDFLDHPRPPPPSRGNRPPQDSLTLGSIFVHAGDPKQYWAAVRLPPVPGAKFGGGPTVLFIVSDSVTGGGLFFDLQPWLIGIFGAMIISALLWLPFVRGITRSIREHMRATEAISRGRFDIRVPETRGDELGRLAAAVNTMATQLDGLVRGQKRFLGDVAHELCSPISRMEMGLALLEQQATEKQAARLTDVREELRQISTLVNELLSFSKAALGQQDKPLERVPVAPLLKEVLSVESMPEDVARVQAADDLAVAARPEMLRRALGNIVRNARLHAPGCAIDIRAARANGHVSITIEDEGPGVPPESLPRLFEPFYRVDASRARETGGVGLGLSIVKTGIESCGGSVIAENRQTHGLRIVLTLASA